MKNNFKLRFMAGLAAVMCLAGVMSSCGNSGGDSSSKKTADSSKSESNEKTQDGKVFMENTTGTSDGYSYELWKDKGDTKMTITEGGTFSCEWSNINNALFRRGQKFDCTKTYKDLGNITIKYGVDYQPNGNSYMCVYGWTRDPLVEYYIVETWGSWRPPGAPEALGTVTVDGATYDVYKTTRYELYPYPSTSMPGNSWVCSLAICTKLP